MSITQKEDKPGDNVPRFMSDFGERSNLGRCIKCATPLIYSGGTTACPECN